MLPWISESPRDRTIGKTANYLQWKSLLQYIATRKPENVAGAAVPFSPAFAALLGPGTVKELDS